MEAKFCPFCSKPLRLRYPGGDPENGPARMLCPDDHQSIEEIIEEKARQQAYQEYRNILEEIQQGGTDPYLQPSEVVQQAAELLLAWDEHVDLRYAALFADDKAACEDFHPEDGPDPLDNG